MSQSIKEVKWYGGIGQLLILFSFVWPVFKSTIGIVKVLGFFKFINSLSLFLVGNVLFIIAIKKLFEVVTQREMFSKFLTFYFIALALIVVMAFLFLIFLVFGFGGALSDQSLPGLNFWLLSLFIFVLLVFGLAIYFYRKSLMIIYQVSKNFWFKLAANFIFIGAILMVVLLLSSLQFKLNLLIASVGILVIFLGFLFSIFGFFNFKNPTEKSVD